jgi:hypothetical protein
VIGARARTVACTTVARPLYVVDCDNNDDVERGNVGAAGFWTSEHAEKSNAPRTVPTSGKRDAFMSISSKNLCW